MTNPFLPKYNEYFVYVFTTIGFQKQLWIQEKDNCFQRLYDMVNVWYDDLFYNLSNFLYISTHLFILEKSIISNLYTFLRIQSCACNVWRQTYIPSVLSLPNAALSKKNQQPFVRIYYISLFRFFYGVWKVIFSKLFYIFKS